eukprot:1321972-Ditylum_brightwellii.AAC.1
MGGWDGLVLLKGGYWSKDVADSGDNVPVALVLCILLAQPMVELYAWNPAILAHSLDCTN